MVKTLFKTLVFMTLFAVAFGIIEASVAHYLRMHYYAEGFRETMEVIDPPVVRIEMIRELATMAVLAMAACLSVQAGILRLANFIYVFAVWDIVYYLGLFFMEAWPRTLLDWDVLFLIPVPWFAPVLAPVAISCLGIAGALLINLIRVRRPSIRLSPVFFVLVSAAWIFWLISFLNHFPAGVFPEKYDWFLFTGGVLFTLVAFVHLVLLNRQPVK